MKIRITLPYNRRGSERNALALNVFRININQTFDRLIFMYTSPLAGQQSSMITFEEKIGCVTKDFIFSDKNVLLYTIIFKVK